MTTTFEVVMARIKTTNRRSLVMVACAILAAAVFAVAALSRTKVDVLVDASDQFTMHPTPIEDGDLIQPSRRVKGNPSTLVVQRDELPSGFEMAQGEPTGGDEFVRVYFNARALMRIDDPDPQLFGVIANLSILKDSRAVFEKFNAQGGLDVMSITREIRAKTGEIPQQIEPLNETVEGVDRLSAFRIRYELQGTAVYEYRYRLVVGNALSNLIMSARAAPTGEEPKSFAARARDVVGRQVARLVLATKSH